MVRNNIDNSTAWNGNDAINFIRNFFRENLPYLKEIHCNQGDKYEGFNIEFSSRSIIVKFSNPKGELNYEVFVNGKQQSLLSYNEIMKEVYVCSKINLELILDVLVTFLKEQVNFQ